MENRMSGYDCNIVCNEENLQEVLKLLEGKIN